MNHGQDNFILLMSFSPRTGIHRAQDIIGAGSVHFSYLMFPSGFLKLKMGEYPPLVLHLPSDMEVGGMGGGQ
jgi:hypothetical protein